MELSVFRKTWQAAPVDRSGEQQETRHAPRPVSGRGEQQPFQLTRGLATPRFWGGEGPDLMIRAERMFGRH